MRVLAIDTAAEFCAACVWDATARTELGRAVEPMRNGHAERLMVVIDAALASSGVGFAGLRRIAVSVGPGSFTGIRVGVATARGLSLALKIPAVGISTLEAIAAETRRAFPARPVVVLVGTNAGPVSAAAYDASGRTLLAASVIDIAAADAFADSLSDPVLAGSAAEYAAARRPDRSWTVAGTGTTADIAVFAQMAAVREPGEKPVPLYLRAPDAKPQDKASLPRRS